MSASGPGPARLRAVAPAPTGRLKIGWPTGERAGLAACVAAGLVVCLAALFLFATSAAPAFAAETGETMMGAAAPDPQSAGPPAGQQAEAQREAGPGETASEAAQAPQPSAPTTPPEAPRVEPAPQAPDPGRDETPSQPSGESARHAAPGDGSSGHESDTQQSPAPAGTVQAPTGTSGATTLTPAPVQAPAITDAGGAFVVDTGAAKLLPAGGPACLSACRSGGRLSAVGMALPRGARPVDRREAQDRAAGLAAEATAPKLLGIPGSGQGLFSLLAGGGGGAVTMMFIGFLAVLGAAFVLAPDWSRSFRLPDGLWSPSAFITPIELPG